MKIFKRHFIIAALLISVLFSGILNISKTEAATVNGMTAEIKTLFQNFLSTKKNIYFKVISMKGTDKPVLLISDSRMSDKTITICDIYIVKTEKKNNKNTHKLVKAGYIQSLSTAYNIWTYKNRLICGSHHYTAYAEIKNDKLYVHCYQGRFDKDGNETFYHLIYSEEKCISEKQISSAKGEQYVYKMWEKQTVKNNLIFYKNTKKNRKNYI